MRKFPFWGGTQQTPSVGKVANVILSPAGGFTPLTVHMSTATTTAHIFYRLSIDNKMPTHDGDSATGGTVRVGSYQGSVSTGSGHKYINAVGVDPAGVLLDSDISHGEYESNSG